MMNHYKLINSEAGLPNDDGSVYTFVQIPTLYGLHSEMGRLEDSEIIGDTLVAKLNTVDTDSKLRDQASNTALAQETSNRTLADASIVADLASEISERSTNDATLNANIIAEANRAKAVEGDIDDLIIQPTVHTITNLVAGINSETASRSNADGVLSSLTTDIKSNLVGAINEVDAHVDDVDARISNVYLNTIHVSESDTTIGKVYIDNKIAYLANEIGDLDNLDTEIKTNLVSAFNEFIATCAVTYVPLNSKGQANGVCPLDENGLIKAKYLDFTPLDYKGIIYDPADLEEKPENGDFYKVGGGFTYQGTYFYPGDWIIYNGTSWERSINSNNVLSVNGLLGDVWLYMDMLPVSSTDLTTIKVYTDTADANLQRQIGTLSNLTTTIKTNLVGAINEVDAHADLNAQHIGVMGDLTTDEQETLVGAINEVDAHIDAEVIRAKTTEGELAQLTTDAKVNLVSAINEVDSHADTNTANIGPLPNLSTRDKSTIVNSINEIYTDIDHALLDLTVIDYNLTADTTQFSKQTYTPATRVQSVVDTVDIGAMVIATQTIDKYIADLHAAGPATDDKLLTVVGGIDLLNNKLLTYTKNVTANPDSSILSVHSLDFLEGEDKVRSTIDLTKLLAVHETSTLTTDNKTVIGALNELDTHVDDEVARAKAAEKVLTDNLNAEIARAEAAELVLTDNLNSEIDRAEAAELVLTNNLNSEIDRAQLAEEVIADNLADEITRAKSAEQTLTTNLNAEVTRAKGVEGELNTRCGALADLDSGITSKTNLVDAINWVYKNGSSSATVVIQALDQEYRNGYEPMFATNGITAGSNTYSLQNLFNSSTETGVYYVYLRFKLDSTGNDGNRFHLQFQSNTLNIMSFCVTGQYAAAFAVLNYQKTSNPTVTVVNLNNWKIIVQDCFFRTIKLASSDT